MIPFLRYHVSFSLWLNLSYQRSFYLVCPFVSRFSPEPVKFSSIFGQFLADFRFFFSIFRSLLSEIKPSVILFIVRVWSPGLTDESWLSSSAQKGNNKVLFKPNELIIRCAMTCSCPQLQTTVKRRSCDNQRDARQ